MSLSEVAAFIAREKHLPNVPSAKDLMGPVNLSKMQMKILEKIEELTLYALDQQAALRQLQARLDALEIE